MNKETMKDLITQLFTVDRPENLIINGKTVNDLSRIEAVLTLALAKANPDRFWKTKHKTKDAPCRYCLKDGEPHYTYFVGYDTKEGSVALCIPDTYWDLFSCKEVECIPGKLISRSSFRDFIPFISDSKDVQDMLEKDFERW